MPLRRLAAALVFVLAASQTAGADTWADRMFDVRSHDFGTIARGADARFSFVVTNPYRQTVHIADVRSTCGCSVVRPSRTTLAGGQSAEIVVAMDTHRFNHEKVSTITVVFDQPQYAEVSLRVRAYIRSDVVLTPGSINFGRVPAGDEAVRAVDLAYVGRSDWRIVDIRGTNPHLEAELIETHRQFGNVGYQVRVYLDALAPPGRMVEQLTLVTNDGGSPYVPLLVEGEVEPAVAVEPAILSLGVVPAGRSVARQVVVRGRRPFCIVEAEGMTGAEGFAIELPAPAAETPADAASAQATPEAGLRSPASDASPASTGNADGALQLVTVRFTAGETTGRVSEEFRLVIDTGEELHFTAFAQVPAR